MADPREVLAARVSAALAAAVGAEYAHEDPVIRPSTFADFQSNVALGLAKRLGRPPREIAAAIVANLGADDICASVEVSGPGFVNLRLRDDWLAAQADTLRTDPRLGVPVASHTRTVVVDYSSPNVAKEMHVGHLRTTVVGDVVVRVLEHLGHKVVRANHLGDWGTQFGMLIEHLVEVGEETARRQLSAGDINAFYQAARAKFDSDPAFAERSRRRVVALQSGDEPSLRLWRILIEDSKQYYNTIYRRLGVTLTDADLAPESFYNPMLAEVCDELQQSGVAVISDGALCAFPAGFTSRDGEPLPMIVRKSDGGYGYGTTDLAAIRYRICELGATRLIYFVAAEQSLHFQMLFAVARQAGWLTDQISAEHAVIGLVSGTDRKRLRTRSGESVKLITLIDEAVDRAERVIADRYPDPAVRHEIAQAVGIGALKYGDLSVARASGYVFDFDRMLALTGDTGPYLQYAAARLRSIFRRAQVDPDLVSAPLGLTARAERALALLLLRFGSAVRQTSDSAEPHLLAGYLFELASAFTTFYEECPVLKATAQVRDSRLTLCAITLRVLTAGLDLLGIPAPDRM